MYANFWMFLCFLPVNRVSSGRPSPICTVFFPSLGFVPRSYKDMRAESMEPNVVTCHLGVDEILDHSQVVGLPFGVLDLRL